MDDIWTEILSRINKLEKQTSELEELGVKRAERERDYRREKRIRLLQLRAEGNPVSILSDLVLGEEKISQMRFERDVAQSQYEAMPEVINTQKLILRILENQMAREWGR